ncbi:transporter [Sphingopyxis terrae]|jgi:hypothetical protein|uniref:transporter n=1 Tax=Sphingopyxis terrae TaxID=33052 RepID=UPI001C2BACFD|nr:transporter [Sphingopyxis terrae]QXF14319.1 transporter [Sphingopyxis terrae subsp. terrae]
MKYFYRLLMGAAPITMLCAAQPAAAVDVDPGDYVALPPGTNLALVYEQFINRDELNTPGGTLKEDTNLNSAVTLLRYVHYMKIGPFTVDPQVIVPIGSLFDARAGGQRLGRSTGLGDITPFATIWLVNKPDPAHGTYLGVSPILTVPTGTYDHNKAINFGGNRFVYNAQVGLVKGLSRQFSVDLIGDLIWYGDNDKFGPAKQTLSQKMSSQFQAWGRYHLPDGKSSLALGYAGYWGGKQNVDGLYNGTRTEHQQVRVAAITMLSKSFQIEGIAARDFQVRDGFREAVRLQLRVAKIF